MSDFVRQLVGAFDGDDTLSRERMERIYQSFATPDELNSAIGVARGETEGALPEALRGLSTEQISQLDRYTDTRRMDPVSGALYGLALSPAWETYKTAALSGVPMVKGISDLLAHPSVPPELQQFSVSGPGGSTSRPMAANVTAPLKGTVSGLAETGRGLASYVRDALRNWSL